MKLWLFLQVTHHLYSARDMSEYGADVTEVMEEINKAIRLLDNFKIEEVT